jgi:hypothetical protein
LFWACNILAVEGCLFIVNTCAKRLTVLVCSKMKKKGGKEIKRVNFIDIKTVFFKTNLQKGTGTT